MNTENLVKLQEYSDTKAGMYQISNYYADTAIHYNSAAGSNWVGKANELTIDDDSYLRNIGIKNSRTVVGNDNFLNRMSRLTTAVYAGEGVFTKNIRSENDKNERPVMRSLPIDIPKRNLGIDSRHLWR